MAGGLGTRMRSTTPKHLHSILGRRMVDWVLEAARPLYPEPLVVIASPESRDAFGDTLVAVQDQALGTGDAVRSAREAVGERAEHVLVLSGDTPLLTTALLEQLVAEHAKLSAAATVLSFEPADPRAYGRVVRGADGTVEAIVEAGDATPEQLALGECNSSIYVFRSDVLWPALERLEPHNVQGELYLTDAVRDLVARGERVVAHLAADPDETEGVNTRVELAAAAAALRDRINCEHMLAGVAIVDPSTTWIEPGRDDRAGRGRSSRSRSCAAPPRWPGRRSRLARRRDRRRDRPGRDRRPLLLPSPRNRPRPAREGRRVRRDQEVDHRPGHQGAASLVHRRRRDRRGNQYRRRIDHRELSASARPAQGQDVDRQQRPRQQWTLCSLLRSLLATMRGRRRVPSSPTTSQTMRSQASRPARSTRKGAVESGTIEQPLPGLEGTGATAPQVTRRPRQSR